MTRQLLVEPIRVVPKEVGAFKEMYLSTLSSMTNKRGRPVYSLLDMSSANIMDSAACAANVAGVISATFNYNSCSSLPMTASANMQATRAQPVTAAASFSGHLYTPDGTAVPLSLYIMYMQSYYIRYNVSAGVQSHGSKSCRHNPNPRTNDITETNLLVLVDGLPT